MQVELQFKYTPKLESRISFDLAFYFFKRTQVTIEKLHWFIGEDSCEQPAEIRVAVHQLREIIKISTNNKCENFGLNMASQI